MSKPNFKLYLIFSHNIINFFDRDGFVMDIKNLDYVTSKKFK